MTDADERPNGFAAPIDEEVAALATEFLRSGGGALRSAMGVTLGSPEPPGSGAVGSGAEGQR